MVALLIILIALFFIGALLSKSTYNSQKKYSGISLADVDLMDGHDFEHYCADLLRYAGFTDITVTRGSGDQGADIIAYKDGEKYAIQCKRQNKSLGNKPIQEVFAGKAFYGCTSAAVMTNRDFTQGAIQAARATGVLLWDRDELCRLIDLKSSRNAPKKSALSKDKPYYSYLTIFIGIVFVLLMVIGCVSGIPKAENKKNDNSSTTEVESTNNKEEEKHLLLGENATFNKASFTVNNIMFARHFGNLKYLDMAENGFLYCDVYVNIENTSSEPLSLTNESNSYDALLIVDHKEVYHQSYIEDDNFLFSHNELKPNEVLKNKAINFLVPADLQYSDQSIDIAIIASNGQSAVWTLR